MSPGKIMNSVGIFASLGTLSLAHKMPLAPLFIFGSAILAVYHINALIKEYGATK